jgi:hypothetical protein
MSTANSAEVAACTGQGAGLPACADGEHICLSTVPIFAALSRAELQQVNDLLLTKKEFKKGELLFKRRELENQLYIVRHGRVKLYTLSAEGCQQTVRILEHGDMPPDPAQHQTKCCLRCTGGAVPGGRGHRTGGGTGFRHVGPRGQRAPRDPQTTCGC